MDFGTNIAFMCRSAEEKKTAFAYFAERGFRLPDNFTAYYRTYKEYPYVMRYYLNSRDICAKLYTWVPDIPVVEASQLLSGYDHIEFANATELL